MTQNRLYLAMWNAISGGANCNATESTYAIHVVGENLDEALKRAKDRINTFGGRNLLETLKISEVKVDGHQIDLSPLEKCVPN